MPRSITGSLSRRRMMRAAVLLAAPVAAAALLSGCGAGQISQTDKMVAAVSGVDVTSKHGVAALRDVRIAYHSPEGYQAGETAPLQVYIANNDQAKPLVLRNVTAVSKTTGANLGTVVLTGGAADVETLPSSAPSASATSASPSASASAKSSKKPSAPASAASSESPSESPSESASPASPASPSPSRAGAAPSLTIPANGFARLDPDKGAYLAITGITESLAPGSSVVLTFTFEGEDPVEVTAPFAVPLSPAPRVTSSEAGSPAE